MRAPAFDLSDVEIADLRDELKVARHSAELHAIVVREAKVTIRDLRTRTDNLCAVINELRADLHAAEEENRALRGQL